MNQYFRYLCTRKTNYLKRIKINFIAISTNMVYELFKGKFVSSPLKFFAGKWSREHQFSHELKFVFNPLA